MSLRHEETMKITRNEQMMRRKRKKSNKKMKN